MNWLCHFLVSNIITLLCHFHRLGKPFTCILCFLVHIQLDVLDKMTYHPEFEEAWTDPFYIIWSVAVLSASLYVFKVSVSSQTTSYIHGLLSGVLIDAWDWIILRIFAVILGTNFWNVHHTLGLHRLCEYVDVVRSIPSLRDTKCAIILEIILISILWRLWMRLQYALISGMQSFESKLPTIHERDKYVGEMMMKESFV
eukprot:264378_1